MGILGFGCKFEGISFGLKMGIIRGGKFWDLILIMLFFCCPKSEVNKKKKMEILSNFRAIVRRNTYTTKI